MIPDEAVARRYAVASLLMERRLSRVHVLVFAAHSSGLPSACGAVIGLREGRGVLRTADGEGIIAFCPDADALPPLEKLVHLLENSQLEPSRAARRIPDTVPYLQLFDAAKPEALNIATRWRRNTTVSALSAPPGIDGDGQLCALDMHVKGQGPHGLIAGTTGSGKSELIITYILGLAVNLPIHEIVRVTRLFVLGNYDLLLDMANGRRLRICGNIMTVSKKEMEDVAQAIETLLNRRQGGIE